ncbi:MAG: MFS transporter [Pantoea sp.]|nr:MFS transporter [Pantoea sp.]MDU4128495.1 MFS transporter [Pantoea sp.]
MAQPDSTPRSLVSDGDRLVSSTRSKPVPLKLVMLLGVTCALAVGNVYFAQPLLTAMAQTFAVSAGSTGVVVTATQVGYGLGLLFVVPLGDLFNGRLLIVCQLLMLALAVLLVSLAPDFYALLIAMSLVGLMAVVVQVVVAYAASLSSAAQRGQVVGMVTGGVVLGILLARLTAGAIADLAGWRAVYLSSAALLVLLAAILWRTAPGQSVPMKRPAWRTLMRAFFRLFLDEPLLRVRGILALLIFAAFSVFWTAMVLPLSQLHFSHTETGLFGLAGIAGALAAIRAGRWADQGYGQRTTGIGLLLLTLSWLPLAWLHHSIWLFIAGVILLDFAVQAVHVSSQSLLLHGRPDANHRLIAAYMCFYSVGSALGASAATRVYAGWQWPGVCLLGSAISLAALLFWWATLRPSSADAHSPAGSIK